MCDFQGYLMWKANSTISRRIYEHGIAEGKAFAEVRFFTFFLIILFFLCQRAFCFLRHHVFLFVCLFVSLQLF
jgi:hypothetical protein